MSTTLCNPMDCSMPGFPVLYSLLEFAQPHVHWCHPTISSSIASSPPALNLKYRFCSNFIKFYASVPLFVFIPYSRLHIVFSGIEQLQLHATNYDKFSFLLQIFLNFPCYGFWYNQHFKMDFNFQIHGIFKVSFILISHLNAFFSAITLSVFSVF